MKNMLLFDALKQFTYKLNPNSFFYINAKLMMNVFELVLFFNIIYLHDNNRRKYIINEIHITEICNVNEP